MVLTNFECWAYGGGTDGRGGSMFADNVIERRTIPSAVDLFNPIALQSCGQVDNSNNKIVSHLSSNGYYGFVPVAAQVDTSSSNNDAIKKQQQTDDDATTTNSKQASFCTEDMDVEQHSLNDSYSNSRNFSPHFWIENFDLRNCQGRKRTHGDNGCSIDRRKRLVAEEDILEARKRAKRCRFDSHREHIFANNNGGCISSLSCGETNNTILLNMDQSVTNSLTVHPDSTSSIIPAVEEQQPAPPVSIPAAVAVISADETISNTKRTLNTNMKLNEKLSAHNFIQKAYLKTVPKSLCEENDSCHRNNFSDVCNNLPNKLKDDGDRHINRDCDDDQLENLFLHLHGGNDYHLRRHLEDDNYCEDI